MDEEIRSRETQEAVDRRMESPQATAVEKVLAVIEGAAEGFVEQSRSARLPETAGRAASAAGASVHEVRQAVREAAPGAPTPASPPPEQSAQRAEKAAGRAEAFAAAAGKAAHRAAEAPSAIAHEMRSAAKQAGKDVRNALVGVAAAGFLAAAAFLFLAHALALGLNFILGFPWGTVVVAVLLLIGAAIAWYAAKAALRDVGKEFRGTMKTVKKEARRVGEPFREATNGRGAA